MILTSASLLYMLSSLCCLQAQLRGLIGDYSDPDEGALASGLEAFDMLNNVLEEHSETAPQVSCLAGVGLGSRLVTVAVWYWAVQQHGTSIGPDEGLPCKRTRQLSAAARHYA